MKNNGLIPALAMLLGSSPVGSSAVLVTHAGGTVSESGLPGTLVSTAVVRDTTASDVLYFRYTVDPDSGGNAGENSYAGLCLFNGGSQMLGVGNNWNAWAYSVFGNAGESDLKSSAPDPGQTYQTINGNDLTTIVFSVAYNPAGNDTLTVWLNPNFGVDAGSQTANRTTTFTGNFSFDNIRLREGGAGNGWNFSNIQVATAPTEIGFVPEPAAAVLGGFGLLFLFRRRRVGA